ncbi:MAG: WecB/TagA/CpsF family glycosyltransferase [Steroidobacter sp.]
MNKWRERLLGLHIGAGSLPLLVSKAMNAVETRKPPFKFACANPHSLVVARKDTQFMDALHACDAIVADGVGVTLAGWLVSIDVGPRITGIDFFRGMMLELNRRGGRAFFFGSTDEVLQKVMKNARHDFPNVHVDVFSPPYGEWSEDANQEMIDCIRAAQPDVLWVGMTAPKQEKWVHHNAEKLAVPVIGSIGAVFQYYAGDIKRAPEWLCHMGFEWLYRLAGEPRRLWRRTIVSAPAFIYLVIRERLLLMVHGEQAPVVR